uniref:hypothetical protein n=1 Tax=Acinetobacter sp. YH12043 TaxID=2601050 RepID=UPI0015D229DC
MPLPTPADIRDKTKKHSQVREMLAQLSESVIEKTKSITNAIDFDTYKTEGSYAIAHDLIATSTNKPIGAV